MHVPLYQRVALALLRVVAAFVIMQHGAQKLFGAFGGMGPDGGTVQLMSLMGVAGILEFFVGLLVLVGLFTRPAAFLLAGEMATAYFMAHFPRDFWTVKNSGEPAVLLCFIFLFLAAYGAGQFSLDALLRRRSGSASTEDALTAAGAAE